MRLALYEPDIPQNTGAIMRLCACFGVPLDVIEPCGFILSDRNLRRAGMDYIEQVDMARHSSWNAFNASRTNRLVLLTTKSDQSYLDFTFQPGDILMAGRESAGVPDNVHNACDARITIPMAAGARSLNVAMACAIVLGEALRQVRLTPP